MRNGHNPLRSQTSIGDIPDITVGVLSYIPELSSYFEEALHVLKLCLDSIRDSASAPFTLLVVDNNSCAEVRDYLASELANGRINILIQNDHNVGEGNGVLQVLRNSPGKYVFYSDSDIYYQKGFMEAAIEIADTYPNPGVIGSRPHRHAAVVSDINHSTFEWVEGKDEAIAKKEQLIPEDWIEEFLQSVGGDEKRREEWSKLVETQVLYKDVKSYIGANHMQFMLTRKAIDALGSNWSTKIWGKKALVDIPLCDKGFLRLSTSGRFVYHIGNEISEPWLREESIRLTKNVPEIKKRTKLDRFWRNRVVRRGLREIYSWTYSRYEGGTHR